jgi:hypothetical protein
MDPSQHVNQETSPLPETAAKETYSGCETAGGYSLVIITVGALYMIGPFLPGPVGGLLLLLASGLFSALIWKLVASLIGRLQKSEHRTRSGRGR